MVAVGGAAIRAVGRTLEVVVPTPGSLAIDTSYLDVHKALAHHRIHLGDGIGGSGGDPSRTRALAWEAQDALRTHLAGAGVVVLVAGMSGAAGGGIAPVVAELAREAGAEVVGVALLPLVQEGEKRVRRAREALVDLRRHTHGVMELDYGRMWDEQYGRPFSRRPWPQFDIMVSDQLVYLQMEIICAWEDAGARPAVGDVLI